MWLLLLLSCGGDNGDGDKPGDSGTTDTIDTSTSIETGDTGSSGEGPALTYELVTTVAQAPLVRRLQLTSDVPVSLELSWTDGMGHDVSASFTGETDAHDHLLLGFRPDRVYTVDIVATDADGQSTTVVHEETFVPLNVRFPTIELTVSDPAAVSPGHTLMGIADRYARVDGRPDSEWVLVFDEEGEIVWAYEADYHVEDAHEHDGGLVFLGSINDRGVHTVGWDGIETGAWSIGGNPGIDLVTATGGNLHHEGFIHPDDPNQLVALGTTALGVSDYPYSYDDTSDLGPDIIAADFIVVFERDGTIVSELSLTDFLPTTRIGYDSLDRNQDRAEWAHSNALVLDGDNWVISMRHQDAVVSFDPGSQDIDWILGHHDNWPPSLQSKLLTPLGDTVWPWHMHAPMFADDLSDGRRQVVLFDNAVYQAAPFTTDPIVEDFVSRVVAYAIDENAMTVEQLWSYDESSLKGPLTSTIMGDADWLDNGNVLSVFGLVSELDGVKNTDAGLDTQATHIIEFDPNTMQDVWHLYISAPEATEGDGWSCYRAQRIESLNGRVVD